MAVHFDQIVPWGRLRDEYERMFDLTASDLTRGILDCGGGPASFTAEMFASGYRTVAVDPIYSFSGADVRARFEALVPSMMSQIRASPDDWVWGYHRDADHLLSNRRAALQKFVADFEQGLGERRYVVGELPSLPFDNGSFGLAVCSHLLFLYSDMLSADFHVQAVRELCRVAGEVRIFPLLTLKRQPSLHLAAVRSALAGDGWASEVHRVNYELQRGGNQMLRVFRAR